MLSYFLVGGVASISLITILNRYRHAGDEEGGDRALSIVLNAMMAVLTIAIIIAEFLAPLYTRIAFPKFTPESALLCTRLTRMILPGPLFFFIGGVLGSRLLVRKIFLYQAITPLIYNLGIIFGAIFLSTASASTPSASESWPESSSAPPPSPPSEPFATASSTRPSSTSVIPPSGSGSASPSPS